MVASPGAAPGIWGDCYTTGDWGGVKVGAPHNPYQEKITIHPYGIAGTRGGQKEKTR